MKNLFLLTSLVVGLMLAGMSLRAADAPAAAPAAAAPALKDPTLDQRVADLEAYIANSPRTCVAVTNVSSKIPGPGPGHNAFQMICAALVLFMTLPGLALFYAGLVSILWWLCGYSMAFHGGNAFLGHLDWKFLNGVDSNPNTDYSHWVSHNVYSMYQLMFAIITPALIVGAIAERMKFSAILLFMTLWMFVVYFPLAH